MCQVLVWEGKGSKLRVGLCFQAPCRQGAIIKYISYNYLLTKEPHKCTVIMWYEYHGGEAYGAVKTYTKRIRSPLDGQGGPHQGNGD